MSKSTGPPKPELPLKWQLVAWQKKDEQFARIPSEWRLHSLPSPETTNYVDIARKCGLLTPQELEITEEYDATALAEAIREKKLKCVHVAQAFCKVCLAAGPFTSPAILLDASSEKSSFHGHAKLACHTCLAKL